ncbi:MAG: SEC-C metal-binding domain-containing protein [Thermoanaerobaculia bacterium]|nr:SEC-C metal-binding domain-containing protein [Thermoanaerobaculia bacterium]
MGTTGRNDPCPCGSGSKYKHCCEGRDKHPFFSPTGIVFGIAILLILVGGVAALLNDPENDEGDRTLRDVLDQPTEAAPAPVAPAPATSAPSNAAAGETAAAPVPQPPGPAPEGKVWSSEHGHWHDAPSVQVEASRGDLTGTVTPGQPPQPGMVWNEEHGHYHRVDPNAPVQGQQAASMQQGQQEQTGIPRSEIPRVSITPEGNARSSNPIARPPGPAPEGKVWSYEHGHWHDARPSFPSGTIPEQKPDADSSAEEQPQ